MGVNTKGYSPGDIDPQLRNLLQAIAFFVFCVLFSVAILAGLPTEKPLNNSLTNVEFVSCYDGDTCTFNILIPDCPPIFCEKIPVRISGIDAPELRGRCEAETALATLARDTVNQVLSKAARIELHDLQRGIYFRVVARIVADGEDIGTLLIQHGMAREYEGKRKPWCEEKA